MATWHIRKIFTQVKQVPPFYCICETEGEQRSWPGPLCLAMQNAHYTNPEVAIHRVAFDKYPLDLFNMAALPLLLLLWFVATQQPVSG